MLLRRALILLAVLLLLWSAAWFVAARGLERGVETWFAEQEAMGVEARYAVMETSGYPQRLALRLEAPQIADPFAGVGWAAPALGVQTGTFRPDRIVAAPEGVQRLLTPMGAAALEGDLSAELQLGGLVPQPRNARLTGRDLTLTPPERGWDGVNGATAGALAAGVLRLAGLEARLDVAPAAPDRLAVDVALEGLTLETGSETGRAHVDHLGLSGTLVLSAPPLPGPAELRGIEDLRLSLGTGAGRLQGTGRIGTDANGLAEGRIDLSLTGWRAFADLAVGLGALDAESLAGWEGMLAALDRDGALELPLVMERGQMRLGFAPLGRAPRLAPFEPGPGLAPPDAATRPAPPG